MHNNTNNTTTPTPNTNIIIALTITATTTILINKQYDVGPSDLITVGIHSALMNVDGDESRAVSFPCFVVSCKGSSIQI